MRAGNAAGLFVATAVGLIAGTGVTELRERAPRESDIACVAPHPEDVLPGLERFEAARRAPDVEAIIVHYAPDAILADATASKAHLGHGEIATFYNGLSSTQRIETLTRTIDAACGTVAVSGTQRVTWNNTAASDTGAIATLRYRMTLAQGRDRWLIVHHHTAILDGALPEASKVIAKPQQRAPFTTGSTKAGSTKADSTTVDSANTTSTATGHKAPVSAAPPAAAPTPVQSPPLELPRASFSLPRSPPVFIRLQRPELLSASRIRATQPTPLSETPALPPRSTGDLSVHLVPPATTKLIEPLQQGTTVITPQPTRIIVPALQLASPAPVTASSFAAPGPLQPNTDTAPPASAAQASTAQPNPTRSFTPQTTPVFVPPLPIDRPAPVTSAFIASSPLPQPGPDRIAFVTVSPLDLAIGPFPSLAPTAATPTPPVTPVVASTAPTAPVKKAASPKLQTVSKTTAAPPKAPGVNFRAGRWIDGLPLFD